MPSALSNCHLTIGRQPVFGRERGIRTPGTVTSTSDFESDPFDHSGSSLLVTSPAHERCREEEIRTLDTVARIHTFQACSFNHSDTSLCHWSDESDCKDARLSVKTQLHDGKNTIVFYSIRAVIRLFRHCWTGPEASVVALNPSPRRAVP